MISVGTYDSSHAVGVKAVLPLHMLAEWDTTVFTPNLNQ